MTTTRALLLGWLATLLFFLFPGPAHAAPSAKVHDLRWEWGERDGVRGLRIEVDFTLTDCVGRKGEVDAYFYHQNRRALRDRTEAKEFATSNGNIATWTEFKVTSSPQRFEKFLLFIPSGEFELPAGSYDLLFRAKIYVFKPGGGATKLAETPYEAFKYSRSKLRIDIRNVFVKEGSGEHEKGFVIYTTFYVIGARGKDCVVTAQMADHDKNLLKDENGDYVDANGCVVAEAPFRPLFDEAFFQSFPIFIPYNEFHLPPRRKDLKFHLVFSLNDGGREKIDRSDWYTLPFDWKAPGTGSIRVASADRKKKGEKHGLDVAIAYDLKGLDGKTARWGVEYFLSPTSLDEEGERRLSASKSFTVEGDSAKDTDRLWAGAEFPLKIGRNVFYYKVWLQVKDGSGWHTVDATPAEEFVIENGSLDLPEVLVLKELQVQMNWRPTEEEKSVIRETFNAFNRRLYDATDGQVRVGRYTFRSMRPHPRSHMDGVWRLYRNFKAGNHGPGNNRGSSMNQNVQAFAYVGSPDEPGDVHIGFDKMVKSGPELYGASLTHEFFHAWFSLPDEYAMKVDEKTKKPIMTTFCCGNERLRRLWNACIMGTEDPFHTELCRPGTHVKETWSRKWERIDCYTQLKRALRNSKLGENRPSIRIPETTVIGPRDPAEPEFGWH